MPLVDHVPPLIHDVTPGVLQLHLVQIVFIQLADHDQLRFVAQKVHLFSVRVDHVVQVLRDSSFFGDFEFTVLYFLD